MRTGDQAALTAAMRGTSKGPKLKEKARSNFLIFTPVVRAVAALGAIGSLVVIVVSIYGGMTTTNHLAGNYISPLSAAVVTLISSAALGIFAEISDTLMHILRRIEDRDER